MTENAYAYSLGPANPNGPVCEDCGEMKFIEEMSEDVPFTCIVCAEAQAEKERLEKEKEGAEEFRYLARYWLAVRPVILTPLHELVDELDEAQARARFLLGERYYDTSRRVDPDASAFNHDRDSRALEAR